MHGCYWKAWGWDVCKNKRCYFYQQAKHIMEWCGKIFETLCRGNSCYTKGLRGALAKAKANAGTIIFKIIENAENRRWIENKDEKHEKDAPNGWYRYDSYFGMPVRGSQESTERVNIYKVTVIVRIKGENL